MQTYDPHIRELEQRRLRVLGVMEQFPDPAHRLAAKHEAARLDREVLVLRHRERQARVAAGFYAGARVRDKGL